MTVKEFKEAMKRGLGRCVLELQKTENVEKYRKTVLWGCTHALSYDPQCEGTRSEYFYELISYFPSDEPFLDAIINKLERLSVKKFNWTLIHCVYILAEFADNERARAAVWNTYRRVYDILAARKRKAGKDLSVFEWISAALVLCATDEELLKVALEIGKLLEKPIFDGGDFEWFYICVENRNAELLKLPEMRQLASAVQADRLAREKELEERRKKRESGELPPYISRYLREYDEATASPVEKLLHDYRPEREEELVTLIKSYHVTDAQRGEGYDWHSAWLDCLDGYENDLPLPRELLLYLYEHELCGYCREALVSEIIRRGWDTEKLREEWKYDSNYDIREKVQ